MIARSLNKKFIVAMLTFDFIRSILDVSYQKVIKDFQPKVIWLMPPGGA